MFVFDDCVWCSTDSTPLRTDRSLNRIILASHLMFTLVGVISLGRHGTRCYRFTPRTGWSVCAGHACMPIACLSLVLLSICYLKWSLSLQIWQTLKYYCIPLCLFLLCLHDFVFVFFATPYLFLEASECNIETRRTQTTILLFEFLRRLCVINHISSHWCFFLQFIIC